MEQVERSDGMKPCSSAEEHKPKAYHASIIVNGLRFGTRGSTPRELAENVEKLRQNLLERLEKRENW